MDFGIQFDEFCKYLKSFIGSSIDTLIKKTGVLSNAKSKNYLITKQIVESFKGKTVMNSYMRAKRIKFKTIHLKQNGKVSEGMSFAPINYCEMVNQSWEESNLKAYLESRFIFFVFKNFNGVDFLENILIWAIPYNDLEGEVKAVWQKTKAILLSGDIIIEWSQKKVITNFPSEKHTKICHVRPHGNNGSDVIRLPVTDKMSGWNYLSKQSFWFNHSYLNSLIKFNVGLKGVELL